MTVRQESTRAGEPLAGPPLPQDTIRSFPFKNGFSRAHGAGEILERRQRDNRFGDELGRTGAGHTDDADRRRKAMTRSPPRWRGWHTPSLKLECFWIDVTRMGIHGGAF